MRFCLFFLLFCCLCNTGTAQNFNDFWKAADGVFSQYVEYGKVHYQALQKAPQALEETVAKIATIDFNNLSPTEQKAFHINAYNILVIHQATRHWPLLSPREYENFYSEETHTVGGQKYSLQSFKKLIEQQYKDNRLLFVLADATLSGATINNFAYKAEILDRQIDDKLRAEFNRYTFVEKNDKEKTLRLSFLFKTYEQKNQQSAITFINNYRSQPLPNDYYLKYYHDNGRINAFGKGSSDLVILKKKKNNNNAHGSGLAQTITLSKGSLELSTYQTIFTATYGAPETGTRKTYYTGFYTANYGITGKFDVGINIMGRAYRENDAFRTSPFKVLEFERYNINPQATASRFPMTRADWAISHIGLQVRHAPFKKFNISFEHGVFFPISNLPISNEVDNKFYLINQIYYYHRLSHKWDMFFSFGSWQPISPGQPFSFAPPLLNIFLNYYVTDRFSLYANTIYGVNWGLGAKFLLLPNFEINFIYNYILPIQPILDLFSQGANDIMNYSMGLRYRF